MSTNINAVLSGAISTIAGSTPNDKKWLAKVHKRLNEFPDSRMGDQLRFLHVSHLLYCHLMNGGHTNPVLNAALSMVRKELEPLKL